MGKKDNREVLNEIENVNSELQTVQLTLNGQLSFFNDLLDDFESDTEAFMTLVRSGNMKNQLRACRDIFMYVDSVVEHKTAEIEQIIEKELSNDEKAPE